MKHVPTVAWRELRSLFVSPVAYGVLSLFAVLAGLFFILGVAAFNTWVNQLQQFQALDQLEKINLSDHLVAQFYDSVGVVLLFLVPGITMGLFAAEKTNGTQELLLTSPLTVWDVVLGKFAAGAATAPISGATPPSRACLPGAEAAGTLIRNRSRSNSASCSRFIPALISGLISGADPVSSGRATGCSIERCSV